MSHHEIPERAFVIAERLRARQNSEAEIRAALVEFELSEKQIKEVLKKTEPQSGFIAMSDSQQRYHSGKSVGLRNAGDKRPVTIPRVSDAMYNSMASKESQFLVGKPRILDVIIDALASIVIRIILVVLALALIAIFVALSPNI